MTPEMNADETIAAEVPEKFRDSKTGKVNLDALITSYRELERKLSTMIPPPDTDEDRARVLNLLGVPDSPDEYEIDVSHGLFDIDRDMNCRLHAKGFTCDQAQEVYNLAAEKMVPMIMEIARDLQADREVERLVAAFGGPEQWREVSRQLLAFGRKNLPPDVLDNLSSSYEGVMALYRLMQGQEPGLSLRGDAEAAGESEGDLQSLMRDPRYWRQKDPAFVAKVTEGFRRMYAE